MDLLKRHTFLDITDRGRHAILEELVGAPSDREDREKFERILLQQEGGVRVPGVVRREERNPRPGFIPVGFSSPVPGKEGRFRAAGFVRREDVIRKTTPYELLLSHLPPPRNTCLLALVMARRAVREIGLPLGVWGSAALEIHTGLPCTHENSDLDLLVAAAPEELLSRFLLKIRSIEDHLGVRVDVELELPNGYGVQLKELFGPGRSIIGKSFSEVALLPRDRALAELPEQNAGEMRIEAD